MNRIYEGLDPGAWQESGASRCRSLVSSAARFLRRVRGHATAADVAARLHAHGVRTVGDHGAMGDMPAAVHVTGEVHVEVLPKTLRVVAYDFDEPRCYPERSHGDMLALVQDILEGRAFVLHCQQQFQRGVARWTTNSAAEVAAGLKRLGVPYTRLVRHLSSNRDGLVEVGIRPSIGVLVAEGDAQRVVIVSDDDMKLYYPLRADLADVVADIEAARTYVFPPCDRS